jgi:hypothetical protein
VVGENPNKKPELSKLNRHYRRSIVPESARLKTVHKKTTISHTSSFVTDDGAAAKIRQDMARNRLQSSNFANNIEPQNPNLVSIDDNTKRESAVTVII